LTSSRGPVDEDGVVSSLVPPEVHNQLLYFANIEGEVVYLWAVSLLLVIRSNIIMSSINLMMELELCEAMQRIQEGTKDAPLWGPHVEDQCRGDNVLKCFFKFFFIVPLFN
jgi:hypothetical protein